MAINARTGYEDDYRSDAYGLEPVGESRTKQSFKDECDINNVVSRWMKSGIAGSSFNASTGSFLDVSNVPDYHTAMNVVLNAQRLFSELPSVVRERFKNDPGEYLRFMDDPNNTEEAIKLGLAVRREGGAEQPPELSAAQPSQAPQAPSESVVAPSK